VLARTSPSSVRLSLWLDADPDSNFISLLSARRVRCGFTRIERWVAIAIIAVLNAQPLPAVQAARKVVRRIPCVNNLEPIGRTLHNDIRASEPDRL
jgi:hypothetical protein